MHSPCAIENLFCIRIIAELWNEKAADVPLPVSETEFFSRFVALGERERELMDKILGK